MSLCEMQTRAFNIAILTRRTCTRESRVRSSVRHENRKKTYLYRLNVRFFTSQKVRASSLSVSEPSTSVLALVTRGTSASFCHLLNRLRRSLLMLFPLSCIHIHTRAIKVFHCYLDTKKKTNKKRAKQCVLSFS